MMNGMIVNEIDRIVGNIHRSVISPLAIIASNIQDTIDITALKDKMSEVSRSLYALAEEIDEIKYDFQGMD